PDGDDTPNYLDLDSDGDGISDEDELAAGTDPFDNGNPTPLLQVTPTQLTVLNATGETSFDVSNGAMGAMAWQATVITGADWLTISGSPGGTNDGAVTLSHTANPNTTETRVAT